MSKRAAARPRAKDPSDLPARARAAAVRLFARHGYEGTSVQQIADELGVTKQALLYHFTSKEGIRVAALTEMVAVWRAMLPRLLSTLTAPPGDAREGESEDLLDKALRELFEFARAEPAYPRFLMQELLRRGDNAPSVVHDISPWVKMAADLIRAAQAEQKVDGAVDPEAWIVTLGTSILATLCLLDDRPGGKPPARRLLREMARVARSSLLPRR